EDKKYLEFADQFEERFLSQETDEQRNIEENLDLAWDLLSILPKRSLKRIDEDLIEKYHPDNR
ncbi:MAG: V-type ATP synthase subunit B, partial [Candidatus Nanohaloarchaea archaeon]